YPLGLRFCFVDPTPGSPAGELGPQVARDYDSIEAQDALASCDVVTYEFESVPVRAAEALTAKTRVLPPPSALNVAQDRLSEKQCFRSLSIPTPEFAAVSSLKELQRACERIGLPAILKTRRLGYDGKGQARLESPRDLEPAFERIGGSPLILEGFVHFERELSLIGVRGRDGSTAFYPLLENQHRDGILRLTYAPARGVSEELRVKAERYMGALLEKLDYVGVLTLELFQVQGELWANEMAPRVHNSGHFSIEGAETSQFENHLRAILGLPLGSTCVRQPSAMLNLIGAIPAREDVLRVPGAHLHLYGKNPRPGRKVGHITLVAPTAGELETRLADLKKLAGAG
ncbi:MAG TPA: 5-(carboxyamino)imidazole ribonucleotide synthase, partial [Polyangiaceae bacterium]|nr:5-(carboxyamino)imidazole ribonucleotide synthase [Polyangiaceae bacterium]